MGDNSQSVFWPFPHACYLHSLSGIIVRHYFIGRLLEPIQPLRQKINFNKAVEHSLSGQAVIVDLRPAETRIQKPVPGSAILLPKKPNSPEWDALAPLLESLKGTPVYVIFPKKGDHPAHFKLMSYQLDLWSVDMTP